MVKSEWYRRLTEKSKAGFRSRKSAMSRRAKEFLKRARMASVLRRKARARGGLARRKSYSTYGFGGYFFTRVDDFVDKVWDERSPLEQTLIGFILCLSIALCINATFCYYLIDTWMRAKTVTHTNPEYEVCDTDTCKRAARVTDVVNITVEPCDSFPNYVCDAARTTFPLSVLQYSGGRWKNALRSAQHEIASFMEAYDEGSNITEETYAMPGQDVLRGFYNVCHQELNNQQQAQSIHEIVDILESVLIVKWPMLEIFESVNIFKTVENLHMSYGVDVIVSISVQRNVMKTRNIQPYIIHVGPPEFLLPQWALLRLSLTSVTIRDYTNLITSIARIFRPRIELEGIAREIISMEYYLAKMLIIKDDFSEYERNVYKLSSLARDKSTVHWHDIIRHMYAKAYGSEDNYDRWLVHIWDLSYLVYIYRLLQDDYNARAIVNYVGWKVVMHFGVLTFRHYFEDFEKKVFGYQQSNKASDVCAELMVLLLPVQSDYLAHNPLHDKPSIISSLTVTFFHEHMVKEKFEPRDTCVATLKALYMNNALREMEKLNASHGNIVADLRTMSPFTSDIIYLERSNTIVIPGLLVHNATEISSLPPVHGFSTIGALIAMKMIEAITFEGSYINYQLDYEDWYSEWSRENYEGLLGCFIDNMDLFSDYHELMQVDCLTILKDVVVMSGASTLAYKAYLMFMGKYEEEFIRANLKGLKITLNQYFFLHFSLNFCESTTSAYYTNFNVPDIVMQLRLSLPLRHNFRMGTDFGCTTSSQMNAPIKCLVI
ncbi:uncharacterized protein LOC135370701 isoform X2 [Ornithodoros turicata]|uniref:uncharacterized protein LOC135370701 isoform X2 n=1 Tax=Ornithodoros turicata TaxID=34597 RepID=UPI0031392B14